MLITVFTATYNRAFIIEKLYRSLQRQSYKKFEWIVIDDGSTDDTEKLFDTWQKEDNFFPIIYEKAANGGKHRAINKGVMLANGELFFIVDSDDYLIDSALEKINMWWNTIKNKTNYCGVSGQRGYDQNKMMGKCFMGEMGKYVDCTYVDRDKHSILGDKAEVFRTDIIKKFPFKEFEGEMFLTEGVVWCEIAGAGYIMRWFNEIIYICNYLEDGLTKNSYKIALENLEGEIYAIKVYEKYRKLNFRSKIIKYSSVYYAAKKKGINVNDLCDRLNCNLLFLKFTAFMRFLREIKRRFLK